MFNVLHLFFLICHGYGKCDLMFVECADELTEHSVEEARENKSIRWEMKNLFFLVFPLLHLNDRFMCVLIFWLKVNSIKDPSNIFFYDWNK